MRQLTILYLGNDLSHHGITPTGVETLGNRLNEDFNIIKASPLKNQFFRILHMWYMVVRWRNSDFLLIDTYSTSAFLFAWTSARLAFLFGLKYIPILHGGALPLRAKKSPKIMTRYLQNAYKVVCPSLYLKTEMEKVLHTTDYLLIPNAIDLLDYPYQAHSAPQTPMIKLLWVRSFHQIYNPTLAIKILNSLLKRGYKLAELCMVGPDKDGSQQEVERFARELGIYDRIRITGKLTKKEWVALAAGYHIFINTTNIDNTPVSVIEAMALGLPIVSTNVGGIPFIINSSENGILVPPNDAELFADAIVSMQEEQLFTKLATEGRATAESYDWKRVRPKWLSVLR
ncbi:MAG: glycosyltransferase involved in cell wall biosynthesis [Roseivirga sp.]|jgi:glycosyltransferase involved in cell wall biosynthesis